MPTLDWRAMGRIWMKPARFKVRDGFLTTFPPRMNQGSGISEQSQHAPRTLLNRCSQSCGPAGRQESPGLKPQLAVAADFCLPLPVDLLVQEVVDAHVLSFIFQEAGQDAVLIGSNRNEAPIADRQFRVVAESRDEPSPSAKTTAYSSHQLHHQLHAVQMGECVTHTDDQVWGLRMPQTHLKIEEISTVGFDRQPLRRFRKLFDQQRRRIKSDDPPPQAGQRDRMHSKAGAKIHRKGAPWYEVGQIGLACVERDLGASHHPRVDRREETIVVLLN